MNLLEIMDIPAKRKMRTENFLDEGTPSNSEDENLNSITDNDLINQILRICYKTADGCIGCCEIKHLIESSSSSPDSGFRTSSEEPQYKSLIIVNGQNKSIKTVINEEKEKKLKSNKKRKRSVEQFSQRKRTKVDLIANQKKNDKVFDKLLEDYRSNSPILNKSGEQLPKFDLDGNEIIENDKTEKCIKPSTNRHSMSSITNTICQPIMQLNFAKSTTQKNKIKFSFQTKSKQKLDLFTGNSTVESSGTESQEKFDLDGNEIIKNDKTELPEISQSETFINPSTSRLSIRLRPRAQTRQKSLCQPIQLDFERPTKQKNKVKCSFQTKSMNKLVESLGPEVDKASNLLGFDLDGNEITKNDKIEPEMSRMSLESINTLPGPKYKEKSLVQPIRLDFETSTIQKTRTKKKLDVDNSTNLIEFDLDGNEIVQQGGKDKILKKGPEISQSAKFIKPTANPYPLRSRNTVPKAENCNKHPYAMCKQKLDFGESITQKSEPKSKNKLNLNEANGRSKSKKSKIPRKNQTSTTALPSISLTNNNNCASEEPARTLYDEDAFMNSAMFDSMFEFESNE